MNEIEIGLYHYSCPNDYVRKEPHCTYIGTLVGNLKPPTNITEPVITIQFDEPEDEFVENTPFIKNINYVHIKALGRYYYITKIIHLGSNIYEYYLLVDVLMSFKDIIYNQEKLIVERNEYDYDLMLKDENVTIWDESNISVFFSESAKRIVDDLELSFSPSYLVVVMCGAESYTTLNLSGQINLTPFTMLWEMSEANFRSFVDTLLTPTLFQGLSQIAVNPSECILKTSISPISLIDNGMVATGETDVLVGPGEKCGKGRLISPSNKWFRFYYRFEEFPTLDTFIDLEPLTRYYMFLPYVGIVEIDSLAISGWLRFVIYDIDVVTGNISVTLSSSRLEYNEPVTQTRYRWEGNIYVDIPYGSSNMIEKGIQTAISLSNIAISTIGLAYGIQDMSTGLKSKTPKRQQWSKKGQRQFKKGVGEVSTSLTNSMNSIADAISAGACINYTGNPGSVLETRFVNRPMIWKIQKNHYVQENYNHIYGRPLLEPRLLSECLGFTKLRDIEFLVPNATTYASPTQEEIDEIVDLLMVGVHLNWDD